MRSILRSILKPVLPVLRPVLRPVRRGAVALRDSLDRFLHPRRRRSAVRTLEALDPRNVLFVCLGNVCRSPYAEWSLRRNLEEASVEIDSAGFIGPGRNPPETALEAARARGLDHRDNVSQVVTEELMGEADLVLVFQKDHIRRLRRLDVSAHTPILMLGDLDPVWAGTRAIVDPWGEPIEDFHRTFERIDRCLDPLVETLTR